MKKLLILLLFVPLLSFGQYSSYYGTLNVNADVNVNANINKNVNVSGNVTKTITTIDKGALANANAIRERNRIESLKVANERDREAMIAIANDPSKAFDYGENRTAIPTKNQAGIFGFKKFTIAWQEPHKSLFNSTGGFSYQNISDNYITTEIELGPPYRVSGMKDKNSREQLKNTYDGIFESVEEYAKYPKFVIGEYTDLIEAFIHSKDINKTKIFGLSGFKGTVIYEDDYEIVIKDNYVAQVNGVIYYAGVRYKGDKDEVTFEELEGRRYYFRKLVDKIISTQNIYNVK